MMRADLYRHFAADGRLLYVGVSLNALVRLCGHRNHSTWYDQITSITIEKFATRAEALAAEQAAIIAEKPLFNSVHGTRQRNKSAVILTMVDLSELFDMPMNTIAKQIRNGTFPVPPVDPTARPRKWLAVSVHAYLQRGA